MNNEPIQKIAQEIEEEHDFSQTEVDESIHVDDYTIPQFDDFQEEKTEEEEEIFAVLDNGKDGLSHEEVAHDDDTKEDIESKAKLIAKQLVDDIVEREFVNEFYENEKIKK
ncbi:MAG: hypothetical protein RR413_03220 [Christensenellaceae bacterium]